jgi:hypothetical protein
MLEGNAPDGSDRVDPNLDLDCDAWSCGALFLERIHPDPKRVSPRAHGNLRVRLTDSS